MIAPEAVFARIEALPTLSTAAVRVAQLARDERSSAADFERVIRPDPGLTANLLRLVNSAYFGLRCRAESVRQAVALLGVRRVSEVAAMAALAPVLPARLPGYGVDAAAFWMHSVATAVLAERTAVELGVHRPDLTFTAGLLHDIGKLAICGFVSDRSDEIFARVHDGMPFVQAEREVLGVDHCEVGAAVAKAWGLSPGIAQAAQHHHDPGEAPATADRTLVDLVHIADALSHSIGFGADAGELARVIDAGAEERLGVKARLLERAAGVSLDAIREMASLLGSVSGGQR